jgi:hypothetical protein
MADVIYVAGMVALFAFTVLFVFACDKIVGNDDTALAEEGPETPVAEPPTEKVAA